MVFIAFPHVLNFRFHLGSDTPRFSCKNIHSSYLDILFPFSHQEKKNAKKIKFIHLEGFLVA